MADYPFTTLQPHLGIVEADPDHRFVLADLPGLIDGAHTGVGLGDAFLKHIERTRMLVHLVELEPHAHDSPADAYRAIRDELTAYSPELAAKPELVALTKADLLPGEDEPRADLADAIGRPVFAISAVSGAGLRPLVSAIFDRLAEVRADEAEAEADAPSSPSPAAEDTP